MGQTSSHKHHTRNDFIKNSNLNSGNYGNSGGGGGGGGGSNSANFNSSHEYNYHHEDILEDEEPTINSKSSYVIAQLLIFAFNASSVNLMFLFVSNYKQKKLT